jgi:single-strand DNA-binding protein
MLGLVTATIFGRLIKDAEIRRTNGGEDYATFSLAINETERDQNGNKVDVSSFYDCISYQKQLFNFLKKGQIVVAEGRLKKRSFKGRDGSNRFNVTLLVNNMVLAPKNKELEQEQTQEESQPTVAVESSYRQEEKERPSAGRSIVNAPIKEKTPDDFEEGDFDF